MHQELVGIIDFSSAAFLYRFCEFITACSNCILGQIYHEWLNHIALSKLAGNRQTQLKLFSVLVSTSHKKQKTFLHVSVGYCICTVSDECCVRLVRAERGNDPGDKASVRLVGTRLVPVRSIFGSDIIFI